MWLSQDGEVKAAIPDALFKIVIREDQNGLHTFVVLIPNISPKSESNYEDYLTSTDRIEDLTGFDFLTVLDDKIEYRIESAVQGRINC